MRLSKMKHYISKIKFRRLGWLPTDLEILNTIYDEYFAIFVDFDKDHPTRIAKIYVPINIEKIANILGSEGDIIFGRLYYHLDRKYAYKQDRGSNVHFFALSIGTEPREIHCINFPYMASVLADLRREHHTTTKNLAAAAISALGAIASAFFAWLAIRQG